MIDTVANEAPTAKLALVISYPTSGSGLIVLLKRPQNLKKKNETKIELIKTPQNHVYEYHICRAWYK